MKTILTFIISFLLITVSYAAENVISGDYLLGKWSPAGKAGCSSDRAPYVVFDDSHTLAAGQGKDINTVGFWDVVKDRIILHVLVSPGNQRDSHPFFQQSYHYQYKAPTVLGVRANSFDVTHDVGVDARSMKTMTRCR